MSNEEQNTITKSSDSENYVIINEVEQNISPSHTKDLQKSCTEDDKDKSINNEAKLSPEKEPMLTPISDSNDTENSEKSQNVLWTNVEDRSHEQNLEIEQNLASYLEKQNAGLMGQPYPQDFTNVSNDQVQMDSNFPFACGYTYQWPNYSGPQLSDMTQNGINQSIIDEFQQESNVKDANLEHFTSTPTTTNAVTVGGSSGLQYPLVYVSPAGLLTVILKFDVAVELTADHTIRVVNHQQKCAAATNKQATATCIYHTAAKIYQEGWRVDAEVFWERKAMLTQEVFNYGWGDISYNVNEENIVQEGTTEPFKDLSKDNSVTLLFSSSAYGPHLVKQYEEIANSSKYYNLACGGICVFINGVKIRQNPHGDVTVTSGVGEKFIKVSPSSGAVTVSTLYTHMCVDKDWNIKILHGDNMLSASFNHFAVSDGYWHYGFDKFKNNRAQPLKFTNEVIIANGRRVYNRNHDAYKAAVRTHRQLRLHLYRLKEQEYEEINGEEVPAEDSKPTQQQIRLKPGEKPKIGKYLHDVQVYECPPRFVKTPRRLDF